MGVYDGLGDRGKALATARRCVETAERRLHHEPNDVRAMYLVAGAYAWLGERERAVERLTGALDLQPDEFTTLYNVACGFARLGERERALEALDRAVGSGRGSRKWFENDADLDTLRGGSEVRGDRQPSPGVRGARRFPTRSGPERVRTDLTVLRPITVEWAVPDARRPGAGGRIAS